MTIGTQLPSTSSATKRGIASAAFLAAILPLAGNGGTVNVNFTSNSPSDGAALDGTGILGGGQWSRLNIRQATTPFNLRKNTGDLSGVSLVTLLFSPLGSNHANGNPVQNESWLSIGVPLDMSISGLVPNGFYLLACYSDLKGVALDPQTSFVANGVSGATNNVGVFEHALPGTAGTDHVILTVRANASGQIALATFTIAGLQIQGVLAGETGPKMDCMITASPVSPVGKGRGIFGIQTDPAQSFTQSGRGGSMKTFFVNTKNTGAEYDKAFLMAFPDRGTRLQVIDKTARRNVTAATIARRYRYDLNAGQTKGFNVRVAATSRSFTTPLKVGIGSSPSTLRANQQDVVTCVITP